MTEFTADEEELVMSRIRHIASERQPARIKVSEHPERVALLKRAAELGWVRLSLVVDDTILIDATPEGLARLYTGKRVPEPIEGVISPWMPVTDQRLLAVIGKLGEESSELSARIFRIIIMGGLDEIDPDSKRTNREELIREISDVEACLSWLRDEQKMIADADRMIGKRKGFSRWMRKIRHILAGGDGSVE